ncbi:MAG: type I glyceraldehyde-3-phosphate dehydrogenase [Patescibacteria group bacterium]|jgi:glyceraldehyde 3-phosphate dehydrogenase
MSINIAINGFGRIGRNALKIALTKPMLNIASVNDLTDPATLAHLLSYDTNYGKYDANIGVEGDNLVVDGHKIKVHAEKDPKALPWKKENVDIVLECTGRFTDPKDAHAHISAGAKRVIISAPAKGDGAVTLVMGVNDNKYNKEEIISNASCTTNCITPVAQIIVSEFGVKKAMMTTIHSYTADQNLQDGPHKDLRRARSAGMNIVPTSTGAASAAHQVVPELKGLFDGLAIRVPTSVVSLADFTFLLKKKTTVKQVNEVFKKAVDKMKRYEGILSYTEEPLVSSDFIGSHFSSIVDLSLTQVVDGDLVKVVAWYDNEWGYANRLVEEAVLVGQKL